MGVRDQQFTNGLQHLHYYNEQYGNTQVGSNYICEDGFRLGSWVVRKRVCFHKGKLTPWQVEALKNEGFVFDILAKDWDDKYYELHKFLKSGKRIKDAEMQNTVSGRNLFLWYQRERAKCKNANYPKDKAERLEELAKIDYENSKVDRKTRYIWNLKVKSSGGNVSNWVLFSEKIIEKNGNPSLQDARECGIPDGYFNELCMRGLSNEQLIRNAKKLLDAHKVAR